VIDMVDRISTQRLAPAHRHLQELADALPPGVLA
jgi:hypothetical protein